MIHRFLIYDRKFNCRLDRRYPLDKNFPNFPANSLPSAAAPKLTVEPESLGSRSESSSIANTQPQQPESYAAWHTLVIKDEDSDEETDTIGNQLQNINFDEESRGHSSGDQKPIAEHSQELILGLTHSLKNMLLKVAPTASPSQAIQSNSSHLEGYSFSFKTSKYRLSYFESFTGGKLVMFTASTDSANNNNTTTSSSTITQENALKVFYSQVLLKYLVTYPLGTIYTSEKSTDRHKVIVKDDFLHRTGFLNQMDEFLKGIEKVF
jgi:hypothetical protein